MSRREDVDNAIWGDPEFRALPPDAKLLYLWSFTNPMCNMAGVYKLDEARMTFETGLPAQRVRRAIDELTAAAMLLYRPPWVWVRTRVKYLRTRSPNMAASIVGAVSDLEPAHPIRGAFVAEYGAWPWLVDKGGEPWERFCNSTVAPPREPAVEPNGETHDQGLPEGLETLQGRARAGAGQGQEERDDFVEWLEHHQRTTGMRPPGPTTQLMRKIRALFRARRADGMTLDDLKLATVGAFNDEHRRKHGYYSADSVLRPEKAHGLVELGRRKAPPTPGQRAHNTVAAGPAPCRGDCGGEATKHQRNNQSGLCDDCYAARVERAA